MVIIHQHTTFAGEFLNEYQLHNGDDGNIQLRTYSEEHIRRNLTIIIVYKHIV